MFSQALLECDVLKVISTHDFWACSNYIRTISLSALYFYYPKIVYRGTGNKTHLKMLDAFCKVTRLYQRYTIYLIQMFAIYAIFPLLCVY